MGNFWQACEHDHLSARVVTKQSEVRTKLQVLLRRPDPELLLWHPKELNPRACGRSPNVDVDCSNWVKVQ